MFPLRTRLAASGDLQNYNTDATIASPEIVVSFQFAVLRQHSPSGLVGDAPILAGDECPDLAPAFQPDEFCLDRMPDHAPFATRTVAMDDL